MKKYSLLIFLIILLTSCKNFFYGITRNFYYVNDYNYWQYGIPSYQVNIKDRYCVFIYNNNNNINVRNVVTYFLENKNITFILEPSFNYNKKIRLPKEIIEPIKQREIGNNFKSCDYLIEFSLDKDIEFSKSIFLYIMIKNLKTSDKNIGFYTMHEDETIFNKKTQEQKIEKMLTEWWKTQIKPRPKSKPLETYCVGYGCKDQN